MLFLSQYFSFLFFKLNGKEKLHEYLENLIIKDISQNISLFISRFVSHNHYQYETIEIRDTKNLI